MKDQVLSIHRTPKGIRVATVRINVGDVLVPMPELRNGKQYTEAGLIREAKRLHTIKGTRQHPRKNPTIAGVSDVQLEGMIDQTSLGVVLEVIQVICEEKAQHILENWQDPRTAKEWESAAAKIGALVRKLSI